jgi:flavin reductase
MNWNEQRPDDAMAGAFEAIAPAHIHTVDPKLFREAMSRLGAAVHVITTDGPAGRSGLTATAVCSVSDSPPTLLICLNRKSQVSPVLRQNGVFCVNTLGPNDTEIADLFAGRTGVAREQCYSTGDWIKLETGAPVLATAVVSCDCRIIEAKPVASHYVIFGAVVAVHLGPPGPALIYFDRSYRQV